MNFESSGNSTAKSSPGMGEISFVSILPATRPDLTSILSTLPWKAVNEVVARSLVTTAPASMFATTILAKAPICERTSPVDVSTTYSPSTVWAMDRSPSVVRDKFDSSEDNESI